MRRFIIALIASLVLAGSSLAADATRPPELKVVGSAVDPHGDPRQARGPTQLASAHRPPALGRGRGFHR
jgi:hypothetical protein